MSLRINKVNRLLQKELAKLIQEEIEGELITVCAVETAGDLKTARVWVACFSKNKKVLIKLKQKAPEFQSFLGKKLYLKNIPRLSFCFDETEERVARIEKILRS